MNLSIFLALFIFNLPFAFASSKSQTCFWQVTDSQRTSKIIAQGKENSSDQYGHACVLQGTFKALELCKTEKYKSSKMKVFQAQGSTRQSHLVSCIEHNNPKKSESTEVGNYIQRYQIDKSATVKSDSTNADLSAAETPAAAAPVATPAVTKP